MNRDNSQHIFYEHRNHDIHFFKFLNDSAEALNLISDMLRQIYSSLPTDTTRVKLHIDLTISKNGPPFRLIAGRMQAFLAEFPDRPAGSIAVVVQRASVLSMLSTFLNLFSRRGDRSRIFDERDADEVEAWLLAEN